MILNNHLWLWAGLLGGWAVVGCGRGPALTGLSRAELLDANNCSGCHPDQYNEWSRSMHAYASQDPVFLAMNQRGQRETSGALGSFCIQCHAPMALRDGLSKDGLNLAQVPAAEKGITCYFCHTVDAVMGTHNGALSLASDDLLRGGIVDPASNSAHGAQYSNLHDRNALSSASLCGACHDILTPPGDLVEHTFQEWQGSVFGQSNNLGALSCGQCHMNGRQDYAAKNTPNQAQLKIRTVHSHAFPGVDGALTDFPDKALAQSEVQTLLGTALQALLCVEDPPNSHIFVVLDNAGTGHAYPSGSTPDRRSWLEVVAYKNGQPIYQSGVVTSTSVVETAGDPGLWLMRDCIFDSNHTPVDMLWQAASSRSNQLPYPVTNLQSDPRFLVTHVPFRFAPTSSTSQGLSVYPDKVTMRIRMQPIALSLLNDLVSTQDLDPALPSLAPTLDLPIVGLSGTLLTWTPSISVPDRTFQAGYGPLKCYSPSNLHGPVDGAPTTVSNRQCIFQ